MSYLRTGLLLVGMTGLFAAVGSLIGGQTGALMALVFAAGMNLVVYWNADRIVLSMHGAHEVDVAHAPGLHALVADLARRAGLPMPRVYIMDYPQPNAFATGRNPQNAAVAVTTGLLHTLDRHEVAGVLSHELAHIAHRDTLIMTVTATIAGAISMLGNFALFTGFGFGHQRNNGAGLIGTLVAVILAPLAAMLVQMAISRTREYAADNLGARICGEPLALASALAKIERMAHLVPIESAEHSSATAHLFFINPLSSARMDNLFSTHPSTENRIAALKRSASAGGSFDRLSGGHGTWDGPSGAPWDDASRGPSRGSPRRPWGPAPGSWG